MTKTVAATIDWNDGTVMAHFIGLLEETSHPSTLIRLIAEGNLFSTVTQTVGLAIVRMHDGVSTPQTINILTGNIYPSNEDVLWSGIYTVAANTEGVPLKIDVKGKRKLKKNDQIALVAKGSNATAPVLNLSTTIFCKN